MMRDTTESTNVVVLCTAPDRGVAETLAKLALDDKVAACVTIIPEVCSYYYWQGNLEKTPEVQMVFKTNDRNQHALLVLLKQHHPYQVPELLVLPVAAGDNEYLSWLNGSLN